MCINKYKLPLNLSLNPTLNPKCPLNCAPALCEQLVEEAAHLAGAAVLEGRRVTLLHPPVEVERVQEPPQSGGGNTYMMSVVRGGGPPIHCCVSTW